MCLCIGMCMHVLYRHTRTCVYRQEDNVGCLLLSFFSLVFEAGSLTEPSVGHSSGPAGQRAPGSSWLCLPSTGIAGTLGLDVGDGD